MREIPLTRGLVAIVDDEDYEWLSKHKWYASSPRQGGPYAVRMDCVDGRRFVRWMHRDVLGVSGRKTVDHINGDPLDNRRSNLRTCTQAQNMKNQRRRKDNSSGYRGVDWFKNRSKWRVRVRADGVYHHVGYFEDLEEAARAYDEAARKYHGEFASLNFPETR